MPLHMCLGMHLLLMADGLQFNMLKINSVEKVVGIMKSFFYPYYFFAINKNQIKKILTIINNRNNSNLNNYEKTIIIHSVDLSVNNSAFIIELILALRLRIKGVNAIIVVDDGVLNHRDRTSLDLKKRKKDNNAYRYMVNKFFNCLNGSGLFLKYSEFITREQISIFEEKYDGEKAIKEYDGVPIQDYAISSVIRCSKDGNIKISEMNEEFYKESIVNSMINIELAKRINANYDVVAVISNHTVYSSWGPFLEYFNKKKIRTIAHSKGQNEFNSYFFTDYTDEKIRDTEKAWAIYKNEELENIKIKQLEDYFRKRFSNTISFTKYLTQTLQDYQIDIPKNKAKTFAIFPNVIWDNSLVGADYLFKNLIEWLIASVKWFIKHDDYNLIIRAHPAEAQYMKSLRSIENIIEDFLGRLTKYKNIFYIPAEAKISSYELFDNISGGLIYNGTLALELAYKKIPVFLAGKPTYFDKAGFYKFKDKEEYFEKIRNFDEVLQYQLSNYNSLLKFCFLYFFDYEQQLLLLKQDKWNEIDFDKIDDVLDGKDKVFEFIIDCIIDGKHDFSEWRKAIK